MRSCFARAESRAVTGPGNRLRQIEQAGVFALAEILSLEQFGKTDDLRAPSRRLVNFIDGALQILVGIRSGGHLHQADVELLRQAAAS